MASEVVGTLSQEVFKKRLNSGWTRRPQGPLQLCNSVLSISTLHEHHPIFICSGVKKDVNYFKIMLLDRKGGFQLNLSTTGLQKKLYRPTFLDGRTPK